MEKGGVFAYWWGFEDTDDDGLVLMIHGVDNAHKTYLIRVYGFKPYVYVELDVGKWTKGVLDRVKQMWKTKYRDMVDLEYVMKRRLYYSHKSPIPPEEGVETGDGVRWVDTLFPFLKVTFRRKSAVYGFEKDMRYGCVLDHTRRKVNVRVHENNASPILQYVCQQNLPTASWLTFRGKRVDAASQVSSCDYEYMCMHTDVLRMPTELSGDVVPSVRVMTFDIEANSSNPDRMPNASVEGDKVFQISCCVGRSNDDAPTQNILITMGKVNPDLLDPNLKVYECKTESDVLSTFTSVIREYDPQVIAGYNIFSFDLPYMIDRAKRVGMFTMFGVQGYTDACAAEKEIKWSSTAYKNQNFRYLNAQGRLYVDMLPIVQRDYKLDNYKLKTVSDMFVGETKDPLTAKDIFKCYRLGTRADETNSHVSRNAMSIVGKYCVQDSVLVFKLFNVLQTWVGLVEMATTCNVPIFTLYTQGQQIKVFSQIYKECLHNNCVVEKDGYIAKDTEKLMGAIVLDPIPGIYDKITPFDFTSLYPTTIIAYNLCFSTLVRDSDPIDDEYCHVIDINEHKNCIARGGLVSMDGTSMPIETMYNVSKRFKVMTHMGRYASMGEWFSQGKKECICIDVDYGRRKLTCTRDHRVRVRQDGIDYWIEAGELDTGDAIVSSIMYPPVDQNDNDATFRFTPTYLVAAMGAFTTERAEDAERFRAHSRLLGFLKLDGDRYQYIARVGSTTDAKTVINDIYTVTGIHVTVQADGTTIHIPESFHYNALHYDMVNGIPRYLFDEMCPRQLLTEFIGGVFGQSDMYPNAPHPSDVTGVAFTSKRMARWIQLKLLTSYGIESVLSKDDSMLDIKRESLEDFYSVIGYRYSQIKQYRLELVVNYMRHIRHATQWCTRKKTFKAYLKHVGVTEDMFLSMSPVPDVLYKSYITRVYIAGVFDVYDISVLGGDSSFVCNGIAVHNCDHDTTTVKKDVNNITCQTARYRFLKTPKGIVPTLLEDLLTARKHTRQQQASLKKEMVNEPDPKRKHMLQLQYDVLEKRQLAYKVSANSVYGAYGTRKGYLPFLPGAQCTTALGRHNILKAGRYIQDTYGAKVVYGDTDSVYVNFPTQSLGTHAELWDFCEKVEKEINSLFIKPMHLSFESAIYDRFFILTKKRYVCLKADRNGKISDKLTIRGVLLTRRDNASLVRSLYKTVVMAAFYRENKDTVIDAILEYVQRMFTRDHALEDYIVTKSIGDVADYKVRDLPQDIEKRQKRLKELNCVTEDDYAIKALPANIQLAEKMRRRGKLVNAGQRIEYVVTNPRQHTAKQFDKIEDIEYAREHSEVVHIDPLYYLKLMSTPLDEVLFVGFGVKGLMEKQYKYRLQKHRMLKELESLFANQYSV